MTVRQKISKEGFNVNIAAYNELIFTSEFPLLKIHKQDSGSYTTDANGLGTATIPHTTGIIPMFLAFTEWYSGSVGPGYSKEGTYRQPSWGSYVGDGDNHTYLAYTNSSNLVIEADIYGVNNTTLKYIYFIFEDPIVV